MNPLLSVIEMLAKELSTARYDLAMAKADAEYAAVREQAFKRDADQAATRAAKILWDLDTTGDRYMNRKITFIKDIRNCTNCSLVSAKNAAEAVMGR